MNDNANERTFTEDEAALLMHLAFMSGIRFQATYAEGEMLACWAEKHDEPPTRAERIAAEVAAAGPAKFHGGDISEQLLAEWDEHLAKHGAER